MEELEATMMTTMEEDSDSDSDSDSIEKKKPIEIAAASSSWKLYENPHFSISSHPYKCPLTKSRSSLHSRNFSDFFRAMDREPNLSDLDNAIALIKELRAELDFERRMRRKVEILNKTLSREAEEETRRRKAAEKRCGELADEIASMREESERCLREAEEERRMLRMAEAWREERLQMKLAEARLAMEDNYFNKLQIQNNHETTTNATSTTTCIIKTSKEKEKEQENIKVDCLQRKEIENPHIKRGIKGMEFPKAVRVRGSGGNGSSPPISGGSKEGRGGGGGLGSNLECQRAQLRVLLRHRNPAASVIIGTPHNLVM